MTTVAAATGASASSGAATNRASIAQNFDSFLLLLTTQLKNQSPLDPLDTNQFTQQLVQFASVEQQMKSNETLTSLLDSVKASNTSAAAGLVGLNVTADGRTTRLADGKAAWTLTPAKAASQAVFVVRDAQGNTVYQERKPLAAGAQTFAWNGKLSTGQIAPEGDYTLGVAALDLNGNPISVRLEVTGRVDRVDLSGASPVAVIGAMRVPLSAVTAINAGATN
jgi:flagellar basal-body rod modification protein FlgD